MAPAAIRTRTRTLGALSLCIVLLAVSALFIVEVPEASAQQPSPGDGSCLRGTFENYHREGLPGSVPRGYEGNTFVLSQDYPQMLPEMQNYPWLNVDVDQHPDDWAESYLEALLRYALAGNVGDGNDTSQDFALTGGATPATWFHAPWLSQSADGREAIHGLTHELNSAPFLLGPDQTKWQQTWAVAAYNDRGGWGIGQIWCDPTNPDPNRLNPDPKAPNAFPDGTMVWKLLFTTADKQQASFMEGAYEWTADIFVETNPPNDNPDSPYNPGNPPRKPQPVRLIQVDLAVRDDRLPLGWAFGTYAYVGHHPGATPWDRLVPVGLQWGDDPGVTPSMVQAGTILEGTWTNRSLLEDKLYTADHLGWGGRLSGPLDNPNSSCFSCHATAGSPAAPIVPESAPWVTPGPGPDHLAPERQRLSWFADVPAGVPFSDTQRTSVDYSLETAIGLQRFAIVNCLDRARDEHFSARGATQPAPRDVAAATCENLAATTVAPSSTTGWRTTLGLAAAVAAISLTGGVATGRLRDRRRLRQTAADVDDPSLESSTTSPVAKEARP